MQTRRTFNVFYKMFLKITDKLNKEFVEEFDYWLATLPGNKQKNISASFISRKFEVSLSQAKIVLKYACDNEILEINYAVKCPNDECGLLLKIIKSEDLIEDLASPIFCPNCGEDYMITAEDVFIVYNRIKKPDVTDDEIETFINNRFKSSTNDINFTHADSLQNNIDMIFKSLYFPIESAYQTMQEMYSSLDRDYGCNTTKKGNALEDLTLFLFNQVKGFFVTNKIKTKTNQFDCTVISPFEYIKPHLMNLFTPYFIIECKNEKSTPSNTYFHKLSSIIDTNEAKLGIIVSRKKASNIDIKVSRE